MSEGEADGMPDLTIADLRDDAVVFVCEHVKREERPVNVILLGAEHFQMHCGGDDDDFEDASKAGVSSMASMRDRHPEIAFLGPIRPGMGFERDGPGEAWEAFEFDDE